MKKTIVFLHNSLQMGGAERMRYALLKNLHNDNYRIKICCIDKKGELGQAIENLGYEIDELKMDSNPKNLFTLYRLIKYLNSKKIDILHTSLFNSNFHGRIAALICGIPYVITEEHSEHYLYQKLKHFPYIFFDFLLSRFTDVIICCSETLRQDIRKKERLPYSKLKTITNCIDPYLYKITVSRDEIRKKFNIDDDEVIFITPAAFSPKKRHLYLLSILRHVKDEGYKFKCFFVGEGPTKGIVQDKANELDLSENIIFLGAVNNIQNYLNASDIFVLPSLKEGLSVALMEGMYLGLPCVVTDIDANREVIENYINGILAPLDDIEGFGKALIYCIKNRDLVRAMGQRARIKIENGYLINNYVDKFCNLWNSLLDEKK